MITKENKARMLIAIGKLMINRNINQKQSQRSEYWMELVSILEAEGTSRNDAHYLALSYLTGGLTVVV